jgi:hypothetical protein
LFDHRLWRGPVTAYGGIPQNAVTKSGDDGAFHSPIYRGRAEEFETASKNPANGQRGSRETDKKIYLRTTDKRKKTITSAPREKLDRMAHGFSGNRQKRILSALRYPRHCKNPQKPPEIW